jgi:Cu/Ag efflux protein CusF
MKHLTQLTLTALAALSLSACGGGEMDHSKMDDAKMDHSTMDHSKMDQMKSMGDTGHTTGIIVSVSPDGKEATIDHQEIEGVGMSAMTMGFGITSAVDLSGLPKTTRSVSWSRRAVMEATVLRRSATQSLMAKTASMQKWTIAVTDKLGLRITSQAQFRGLGRA